MSRRKLKINLNRIENFAYALQLGAETIKSRLESRMSEWAGETKNTYDSLSGHAKLLGKNSFYRVKGSKNSPGLIVSVGHESFVARFLEVGTKTHSIVHKSKNGEFYVSATVKGIKGNKPLSKAINRKKKYISDIVHEEVEKIIKGR